MEKWKARARGKTRALEKMKPWLDFYVKIGDNEKINLPLLFVQYKEQERSILMGFPS